MVVKVLECPQAPRARKEECEAEYNNEVGAVFRSRWQRIRGLILAF